MKAKTVASDECQPDGTLQQVERQLVTDAVVCVGESLRNGKTVIYWKLCKPSQVASTETTNAIWENEDRYIWSGQEIPADAIEKFNSTGEPVYF